MKLVTVFTSFSVGEAEMIRSRLDAAAFHPVINQEYSALNSMAEGGVRVQVPEDEAASAKELLDAGESPTEENPPG